MATTLKTKDITTLRQFSSFVEKQLEASADFILWFRGTGKASVMTI